MVQRRVAGRRPDPPPLRTDDVRTVTVATVLWAVALLVLTALRAESRWIATAGCGLALGFVGIVYCKRREAAIARDEAAARKD